MLDNFGNSFPPVLVGDHKVMWEYAGERLVDHKNYNKYCYDEKHRDSQIWQRNTEAIPRISEVERIFQQ